MKLHENEVDFSLTDESKIRQLTKFTIEAGQLGKQYLHALGEQLKRQGVVLPPVS